MIRRDYILRMVEEFFAMLSRLQALKRGQQWKEAGALLDEEFQKLVGAGPAAVAQWSDTELLARVIAGESSLAVREKALIVIALLKEAGDVATAAERTEQARCCYLKALHLLLDTAARAGDTPFPEFVPRIESLLTCLEPAPLPLGTQALLMRHYEQTGQFARAENRLFTMLELERENAALLDFGLVFYERLRSQTDAALEAGELPRAELEAGANELRRLKAARESSSR